MLVSVFVRDITANDKLREMLHFRNGVIYVKTITNAWDRQ
jgi:hypothetical protein